MQYSFIAAAGLVATVSASAISTIADGQPQAAPTPAPTYAPATPSKDVDSTTTEFVTHLTTVCPAGTHTYGTHVVTATQQTTVTISSCYCTLTKAVPTAPASTSPAPVVVPTTKPEVSTAVVHTTATSKATVYASAPAASAPAASAPAAPAASAPAAPAAPAASAPVYSAAPAAPAASAPAAPAKPAAVVSQINDNQPQAPTSAPAASGPAASAPAAPAASAPAAASPSPSPLFTAGAPTVAASGFSFAAVLAAVAYVL